MRVHAIFCVIFIYEDMQIFTLGREDAHDALTWARIVWRMLVSDL